MSGAAGESSTPNKKKTKGRQKIDIKRIENEVDRLVTFSKRRTGIYNKASELVTLCGAEVCFGVFSPSGKAYSFGHPSVETMLNRLMNENPTLDINTSPLVEANRNWKINELNKQVNETMEALDIEMEKKTMLDQLNPPKINGKGWWEVPTADLSAEQLQQHENKIDKTLSMARSILAEKMAAAAAAMPPLPPAMMDPNSPMMYNPYLPSAFNMGNDDGAGPSNYYVPLPYDPNFPPHWNF